MYPIKHVYWLAWFAVVFGIRRCQVQFYCLMIQNATANHAITYYLYSANMQQHCWDEGLLRPKLPKGQAKHLYNNTLALYIHACSHQKLPLVVHNVSTAITMNTVALQLSMHQASVLSNNLYMVIEPLLQHTASACTFEDMEPFCSILLLLYQQVATEKHASCSCSKSKKWALPNILV